MSVCSANGASGGRLYCKGAAEIVLRLCSRRLLPDGGAAELPIEEKQDLLESFSADGNRCAQGPPPLVAVTRLQAL